MSPTQKAKDIGETASPWAVMVMAGYLILTGSVGGRIDPEDLGTVAAAAASEVQKSPSGEVVDLKFNHINDSLNLSSAALLRIEQKLDPMARTLDSNTRRLDAIETWIAKQGKGAENRE